MSQGRTLLQSLVRGDDDVLTIYSRNVSEALYVGLQHLNEHGIWKKSRSGRVIEYPNPVVTVYKQPEERVLFYPDRDANPFFHLFESLWMLAGRRDVAFVEQFNSRMKEFSDDGETFHGAYGYRWRNYFEIDQLHLLVQHLLVDRDTRRAVLQMWSPEDLERVVSDSSSKDVPCNTQVYFKVKNGRLQMTVNCRSNDIIWGTYGANAVHFSILQEYIAARTGLQLGTYYHWSDSFHAYEGVFEKTLKILEQRNTGDALWYDSYIGWNKGMHYSPEPMFDRPQYIDQDLNFFLCCEEPSTLEEAEYRFENKFFTETACPMLRAWRYHKDLNYSDALECLDKVTALDWRKAAIEWIERRKQKLEYSKR